jgi:hypothetical protein
MITLEDCTAFCDASEPDVARIASEQKMTMVVAIACAHSQHVGRSERGLQAPRRVRNAARMTGGKVDAAGLLHA